MSWGYGNLGGGSGSGLKLKIKNGPLEAKPAIGKQNDLFIVSDIPVKYYIMSSGTPSISNAEGTYWLKISDHGENLIDLLDKNDLLLRMESVSVLKSGKWEKCPAFLWHDGAWIEYRKDFVIFKATPGQWPSSTFKARDNTKFTGGSDGVLQFQTSNGSDNNQSVETIQSYDFSPYSVLHARVSSSDVGYPPSGGHWPRHCVAIIDDDDWTILAYAAIKGSSLGWVDIPIASVAKTLPVRIMSYMGINRNYVCKCTDLWME